VRYPSRRYSSNRGKVPRAHFEPDRGDASFAANRLCGLHHAGRDSAAASLRVHSDGKDSARLPSIRSIITAAKPPTRPGQGSRRDHCRGSRRHDPTKRVFSETGDLEGMERFKVAGPATRNTRCADAAQVVLLFDSVALSEHSARRKFHGVAFCRHHAGSVDRERVIYTHRDGTRVHGFHRGNPKRTPHRQGR